MTDYEQVITRIRLLTAGRYRLTARINEKNK